MEAMAQEWTDGRLDELSQKVDRGFERVDRLFERVDRRFEKVDADIKDLRGEIAAVQRTMVQGFIALTAAMLTGFGGLAALIATQG
jgi:hypothetical protein